MSLESTTQQTVISTDYIDQGDNSQFQFFEFSFNNIIVLALKKPKKCHFFKFSFVFKSQTKYVTQLIYTLINTKREHQLCTFFIRSKLKYEPYVNTACVLLCGQVKNCK